MKFIYLLLCSALVVVCADQKSYQDYKVYSVHPVGPHQLDLLSKWQDKNEIDFWSGLRLDQNSKVMASPDEQSSFEAFLLDSSIEFSVLINNVEEKFIEERRMNAMMKNIKADEASFNHFWTLDEIYAYMENLAALHPNLIKVYDLETTYEGRVIKGVTIGLDGSIGNNPVMFVDGGIHAREWISHMTVMYLIFQLVERSAENYDLLENVDWVIIPVVNPDGYVYSFTEDRLWRKNRTPQAEGCVGVDLNRNYDIEWMPSADPCSLTYSGTSAFSEIESRTVRHMLGLYESALVVYATFHSYGNLVLFPYSYHIDALIVNHEENRQLGEEFAAAVKAFSGTEYRVGSSAQILYTSNGNSKDYAGAANSARISYTIELTGGGEAGFDLPATDIYRVVTETFEGVKVLAHFTATAN